MWCIAQATTNWPAMRPPQPLGAVSILNKKLAPEQEGAKDFYIMRLRKT